MYSHSPIPCTIVQGTRVNLADTGLLGPLVVKVGTPATLHRVQDADHSFHGTARSGRNDRDVMNDILDEFAGWTGSVP